MNYQAQIDNLENIKANLQAQVHELNETIEALKAAQSTSNEEKARKTSNEEKAKAPDQGDFNEKLWKAFYRLDSGFNYGGLVPIWHVRKELGMTEGEDRIRFNECLLEMQATTDIYLQSGEARGATPEQKADGVTTELRGLLFYISVATW